MSKTMFPSPQNVAMYRSEQEKCFLNFGTKLKTAVSKTNVLNYILTTDYKDNVHTGF